MTEMIQIGSCTYEHSYDEERGIWIRNADSKRHVRSGRCYSREVIPFRESLMCYDLVTRKLRTIKPDDYITRLGDFDLLSEEIVKKMKSVYLTEIKNMLHETEKPSKILLLLQKIMLNSQERRIFIIPSSGHHILRLFTYMFSGMFTLYTDEKRIQASRFPLFNVVRVPLRSIAKKMTHMCTRLPGLSILYYDFNVKNDINKSNIITINGNINFSPRDDRKLAEFLLNFAIFYL